MALIFRGKSECRLCGRVIGAEDEVVAFPAFLTPRDPFWSYSDAAFHATCFASDPNAVGVQQVYQQWSDIYGTRPRNLQTDEDRMNWARTAFANFRKEWR